MTTIDNTLNGQIVSFTVYPAQIITSDFTNVEILGIVSYAVANGYGGFSPANAHADVYPYLPSGTPNDYTAYQYVILKYPNGKTDVVGVPWINASSLTVNDGITIIVTLPNKALADIDTVRSCLEANGITGFTITQK